MEVYKTEEEQVQAIKDWWKENAVALVAGIVIGLAVLGGYRYWKDHKITQAEQASLLYSQMLVASDKKAANADVLMRDYTSTPYAALASLMMAKAAIDSNKLDEAVSRLKWVLDNSDDEGIEHIARQRLARVYIEKKDYASAQALLADIQAAGFKAGYYEILGDLNLAQNRLEQARENYRFAMTTMGQGDPRYRLVKMKLDDIKKPVAIAGSK